MYCGIRACHIRRISRKSRIFCSSRWMMSGARCVGPHQGESSAIPEDCRWPVLRDLQAEELTRRYSAILDQLSRLSGIVGTIFLQPQTEIQNPAKLPRLR